MDEQSQFLKSIVTRLDSVGIRYMLTGSLAMAIYAPPRMTRDIDLVVECRPEDAESLERLFKPDCYVDVESIRGAAAERSMFNIIHNNWIIKADFIVRKDDEYRRVEFERRRVADFEGMRIHVVAPEDLILSKLLWSKQSYSELHTRDVFKIVESVGDLDWPYLERWSAVLGVSELLEKVRRR